jgi:hypothetical protein
MNILVVRTHPNSCRLIPSPVGKTTLNVIIHKSARLHEGITDRGPHKPKPTLF